MSDRAAKQARRAKRKAKRFRNTERQYRCVDCGEGPLWRGGIEIGDRNGERHYCPDCMTPERAAAIMATWGKS